jgi:hypothetical protein
MQKINKQMKSPTTPNTIQDIDGANMRSNRHASPNEEERIYGRKENEF